MNLKEALELFGLLTGAIVIIYRMAKVESAIYQAISQADRQSSERIARLETRLDLHIQSMKDRAEHVDYLLHALDEKLDHKFKRHQAEIKDVQGYLQREGKFVVRKGYRAEEEEE